jgi:hypothetical protein
MQLRADPALRAAGRLLLAAVVVGACALLWEATLLDHSVPLFRAWLDAIDGTFRTLDLRSTLVNGEVLILRVATPAVPHVVGSHVIVPTPGMIESSAASAGLVLQPLVLGASLVLAWPWRRWQELCLRAVLAVPLLGTVVLLDVPLMLYGSLWYNEVKAFEPDRFSPLVLWPDFMNAGGRFALTIVAVVAAVAAARALTVFLFLAAGKGRIIPSTPGAASAGPPGTAHPDTAPSPPPARAA